MLAITWGLGGIGLILGGALVRLTPWALDLRDHELGVGHWLFGAAWVAFMAYTEGYRGFQGRFSPTVVARAWALAADPRPHHLALAPLFCMGFFHATRKRRITAWALTLGIAGVVAVVKQLPQPWRGLVDMGVLVGLSWGAISIALLTADAVRRGAPPGDPQLPEGGTG